MQENYARFPYNHPNYDKVFITKKVIEEIINFCENHPEIREVYAKWSLPHWCIIAWSDIDHVRIRVNKQLNIEEKVELVNELEEKLMKIWIKQLWRIREDNYIRVFCDWSELDNLPLAKMTDFEIFPNPNLHYWDNVNDYLEKVIKTWISYQWITDDNWVKRMQDRILINLG